MCGISEHMCAAVKRVVRRIVKKNARNELSKESVLYSVQLCNGETAREASTPLRLHTHRYLRIHICFCWAKHRPGERKTISNGECQKRQTVRRIVNVAKPWLQIHLTRAQHLTLGSWNEEKPCAACRKTPTNRQDNVCRMRIAKNGIFGVPRLSQWKLYGFYSMPQCRHKVILQHLFGVCLSVIKWNICPGKKTQRNAIVEHTRMLLNTANWKCAQHRGKAFKIAFYGTNNARCVCNED